MIFADLALWLFSPCFVYLPRHGDEWWVVEPPATSIFFVSSLDPARTDPSPSSLNDFLGSGYVVVFLEDIHRFDDVFVFPLVLFIFLFMKLNGGG
jgi:hypothetical protein